MHSTRGSARRLGCNWPWPTSTPTTCAAPVLQQAVGETAGGLADVQAAQAGHRQAGGLQRAFELEPAARHVARFGGVEQLDLGACRAPRRRSWRRASRRRRRASARPSDQALGLRAGRQAASTRSGQRAWACDRRRALGQARRLRPAARLDAMAPHQRASVAVGVGLVRARLRHADVGGLLVASARSAWRRPSSGAGARPSRPGAWAAHRPCRLRSRRCLVNSSICAMVWLAKLDDITKLGWPVPQPRFTRRPLASRMMRLAVREDHVVDLRLDLFPLCTFPATRRRSRCRSGRCCRRWPGPSWPPCARR